MPGVIVSQLSGDKVNERRAMSYYTRIIDLQKLGQAWDHVRKNKPACGVDQVTCDAFEARRKEELQQLHLELTEHRYTSLPVRQVTLYKGEKARTIALFSMRDKVVQQSVAAELGKLFEPKFVHAVYAYRPGRSALEAVHAVSLSAGKYEWVLKADIQDFFDHIQIKRLLAFLQQAIREEDVIELIRSLLQVQILQEDGTLEQKTEGVCQGASLAPVLSNIYMIAFDRWLSGKNLFYIRYSDDILVMGHEQAELEQLLLQMQEMLGKMGLHLHEKKTCICKVADSFSFLGYVFDQQGKHVPKKAADQLQEKLELLWLEQGRLPVEQKLKQCAEIIEGWEQYYRGERRCGSIIEYAVLLYMTRFRQPKVYDQVADMRQQQENVYRDLLDFFLSEWKRTGKQEKILFEYEQYVQVPDAGWYMAKEGDIPKRAGQAVSVWMQELLVCYEKWIILEEEDVGTSMMQLYSDLGAYKQAAYFQEKLHGLQKTGSVVQALESGLKQQADDEGQSMDFLQRTDADGQKEMEKAVGTALTGHFSVRDLGRYQALFAGREDIYARETIQYGGKHVVEQVLEPLTEDVIKAHLRGEVTVCTYVQRSNHTAHFLVLDVDISKKILLQYQGNAEALTRYMQLAGVQTQKLLHILNQLGLKGYPEFSGRRGYHIWVFFSEWVPVRYLHLLEDVIEKRYQSEQTEEIQVEYFPNQIKVKPGSAGQGIRLPLGIHGKSGQVSRMLEEDLTPVAEISRLLQDVAACSLNGLRKILSVHMPEEQSVSVSQVRQVDPDLTGFGELPDGVRVVLENCSLSRFLCQKARTTGYLTHGERLSVLYVFGHLGEEGKEFVHRIMQFTLNYQYHVTERFIRKLPEKPISCVKLREQYKTITAEYGCSCVFKRTKNCYPSPVLHAIRNAEGEAGEVTIPTSRTLTKEKEKVVYEEMNIHKTVQEMAGRILELKKQKRSLDRSIEKVEKELETVFDTAGIDCLEIEMGLLNRRRLPAGGYEWMIQI